MHTCCRLYLILVNEGNIRENVNPIALHIFIQLFIVYESLLQYIHVKYNFSHVERNISGKTNQLKSRSEIYQI